MAPMGKVNGSDGLLTKCGTRRQPRRRLWGRFVRAKDSRRRPTSVDAGRCLLIVWPQPSLQSEADAMKLLLSGWSKYVLDHMLIDKDISSAKASAEDATTGGDPLEIVPPKQLSRAIYISWQKPRT